MPNRIAVTTILTAAAILATGTVAFASTLADPPSVVGTDAAVRAVVPTDPPAVATPAPAAFDPDAVARLAFAAAAAGTPPVAAPVGAPAPTPFGFVPREASPPAVVPSTPPPTTSPTTRPAPSTPTTTRPRVDCHGSDDGMTEAEKQAREALCGDD